MSHCRQTKERREILKKIMAIMRDEGKILLDYSETFYYIQNLIGNANFPIILPVLYCQAHEASHML